MELNCDHRVGNASPKARCTAYIPAGYSCSRRRTALLCSSKIDDVVSACQSLCLESAELGTSSGSLLDVRLLWMSTASRAYEENSGATAGSVNLGFPSCSRIEGPFCGRLQYPVTSGNSLGLASCRRPDRLSCSPFTVSPVWVELIDVGPVTRVRPVIIGVELAGRAPVFSV